MNSLTLSLFHAVSPAGIKPSASSASVEDVTALLLAYRFAPSKSLTEALASLSAQERGGVFLHLLDLLAESVRTTGAPTSPLYRAFPNHEIAPLEARWAAFVLRLAGHEVQADPALYGADPITGFQDALHGADPDLDKVFTVALAEGGETRALRVLHLADDLFIRGKSLALMGSLVPLSQVETRFVEAALQAGILTPADLAQLRFREKLPLVFDYLEIQEYGSACTSVTDALRLARVFSGADAGTASAVRFQLSTAQAKTVLNLVEIISQGSSDLETDLLRHEEAWKRLATHVRSKRFSARFPTAVALLEDLREGKLRSWQSRLENAPLLERIEIAAERPGVFVRSIGALLRAIEAEGMVRNTSAEYDRLLTRAREVFPQVDALKLIQLHVYLERTTLRTERFHILPDGKFLTSTRAPLSMEPVREILEDHLHARLDGLIDADRSEDAARRFLPAANRSASEGDTRAARGDRVKISAGSEDVVRLFLHWHHHCDVDLSAVFYGTQMDRLDECSYFSLEAGSYARHSGDILDGSEGAAEYIDIDVAQARAAGVRYVLMSANVYSGESFSDFPAHVGMMLRDGETGKHFEISTVQTKMRLAGKTRNSTPAYLDLETGELVHLDLPGHWRAGDNVATGHASLEGAMRLFENYADYRPSFDTVLRFAGTDGADPISDAEILSRREEMLAVLSEA